MHVYRSINIWQCMASSELPCTRAIHKLSNWLNKTQHISFETGHSCINTTMPVMFTFTVMFQYLLPMILPPSSSPPVLQTPWVPGHNVTISPAIAWFKASCRNWNVLKELDVALFNSTGEMGSAKRLCKEQLT